jgi:Rrf2 family protein
MKLTRASSYALHALAFMAAQKEDKPVASWKIAKDRKIPMRFLLKVLKPLVSARILRSIKGPNGGYQLARPANEITILDVIETQDGQLAGHAPLSDGPPSAAPLNNKLETLCKQTADMVRRHLKGIRVSELIKR